jgi:beta-galactosidase/beta-glucuronidase
MLVERLAAAPNPQFSRPGWHDLTGEWRFAHDDADVGLRERWFLDPSRLERTITVPYPPESPLSGIDEPSYHPVVWYARELPDIRTEEQLRLLVTFGAVDYQATVWVDGVQVGEHRGGHTPFSFDVTDALDGNAPTHWVVVRAADDPRDVEQPRGKQDWLPEPHVIWYQRTTGIWQPVWVEATSSTRIERVRWRYDASRGLIDYEVDLTQSPPPGSHLSIDLEFGEESIAAATVSCGSRVVAGQIQPGGNREQLTWHPDRPSLIGATISFVSGNERDVVESYLGLRTIELTDRRFLINGRPVFLRLVLEQGYWPESHLAAPSPEALKREVELIKELGFNGARIHQKVEDPRFLYWADRLGLMVWGEIANAFVFSERAIDRHLDEWREAVLRDRNHPSIIAWVPFNESWGVGELGRSTAQQEAVRAAYHRTHMLDGTRPVVGNDGWEYVAGDLLTIHDYSWDPEVLRSRYSSEDQLATTFGSHFPGGRYIVVGDSDVAGKPVMVTEYGGVSYAPASGEAWFGYGKVQSDAEFLEKYRQLTEPLAGSSLICGFCYTQLTDTVQETNGLLDERRNPKAPIEEIRKITTMSDASQ